LHFGEDVGEASLTSPRKNIGEDTLPSSPVIPASSLVLDTGAAVDATATIGVQMEEGEIEIMASQETVGPCSQRFVAETPQDVSGGVSPSLRTSSSPKFGMEDSD
jgi:hypothetical protein